MSALERSVIQTLCWFSLFEYPLTAFEVWKWLWKPERKTSLEAVIESLQSDVIKNKVSEFNGHYVLKGRGSASDLVEQRRERFLDATRKFARVRKAAQWFGLLTGLRAIACVNTMGWWYTREQSDMDLFFIVRPGTIWSTRLFLVLPFLLSGSRPEHPRGQKDPFCFTFFVTNETLNMEPLCLSDGDPYMAYWTRSIVPALDRDDSFKVFAMKNAWVDELLPNASFSGARSRQVKKTAPGIFWHRPVEHFAERVQRKRFPLAIQTLANKDSRVVISERMLKFHHNDDRAEYRQRFLELCRTHGA